MIITYNGKQYATTGLNKPHTQYKRLVYIKKWNILTDGMKAEGDKWSLLDGEMGEDLFSDPSSKILTTEAVTTKPASLFQSAPQGMVLTI